jgi:RNA polymerase sigma-70 factor (ECF subfamily)
VSAVLADIERVYRARGADFFRFALARTGDPEAARDAVQDGFARALRARRSFRGQGSLEAWLARCVINAAHDLARRSPPDLPEPSPPTEADADATAIREAVRRLPQRQRDALFLRYYLGLDYSDIAEVLGVKVGTVSATLHAARASLGASLQEVPS